MSRVVISARTKEDDPAHWMHHLGWEGRSDARSMQLEVLTLEGVHEILQEMQLPSADRSEQVAGQLFRLSEGFPLLVRLYVQLLMARRDQPHLKAEDLREIAPGLRGFFDDWHRRLQLQSPEAALVVEGDAEDLARMLGNVLGNAVKFTPAGGSVRVRLGVDGRYARVDVLDTGIGIPPEELDLVFDGFFRSSRSRRDETPGTGLGLTIAQSIARRHAGVIEVATREPAGTAVEIRLPLAA